MQKKNLDKKVIITGGGSGGHVSVATSIIDELKERYDNVPEKLLYIGGDLGMVGDRSGKSHEEKIMKGSDINFKKIRAGKLQRSFEFETIRLLFRSILGFFDSWKYISEFKPDLIISTGGFVSVPVSIVAWFKKIPLYLHEQTAAVGLSNSLGAKVAKKIFVAFKDSLEYFPKEKTMVVGNPVRRQIFEINTKTSTYKRLQEMKESDLPIIYISGGGLGSHKINSIVRDSLVHLLDKYQLILQTGDNQTFKDYDVLTNEVKKLPKPLQARIIVTKYVNNDEIGSVFKYSDFFLGRAGANTVYELGILRKPCILIPIPWVTHNEQEKNARILEKIGLGKVLIEGELSRESLLSTLKDFARVYENRSKSVDEKEIEEVFPKDATQKMLDNIALN